MWTNQPELYATHCQGEPSSRSHTEAGLAPLSAGAGLLGASWHLSYVAMAGLPFLICLGLENQIKPRSSMGALHSSLSAKHALSHLNLTTAPSQAGISCVTVQVI